MGDSDHAGQVTAEPVNVARIIDGHDGSRAALISRNRTITYDELAEQSGRLRGGLARLGVADGDRVAVICGNGHPFVIAYLAIVGLGAVLVPLNPTSPAPELQRELAAVDPVAVIVDRTAAGTWRDVDRAQLGSIRTSSPPTATASTGALAFDDLLTSEPLPVAGVDPDHLAALMFTSGTAGSPRAAMLTHGNLLAEHRPGAARCPTG